MFTGRTDPGFLFYRSSAHAFITSPTMRGQRWMASSTQLRKPLAYFSLRRPAAVLLHSGDMFVTLAIAHNRTNRRLKAKRSPQRRVVLAVQRDGAAHCRRRHR